MIDWYKHRTMVHGVCQNLQTPYYDGAWGACQNFAKLQRQRKMFDHSFDHSSRKARNFGNIETKVRFFGKGSVNKLIAFSATIMTSLPSLSKVRNFGKGKCKLIAKVSATMMTSLPSLSVCISLSLSLSPKVPHAQYRKRFRASYNTDREREIDGSDVTIVALKLAMNLHSLPKIRTIGDELTLSLAKNSHFSLLPSHFPSLPSRRDHHGGAEICNEFTLSIAKNFFALRLCSPSFKWHEPRDE